MTRFVSAAALITLAAACQAGSERNAVDTSATTGTTPAAAPAPGGAMQPDSARGTMAQPASPSGAATSATPGGSVRRAPDTTGGGATTAGVKNQTQSGVTNTKTGKSTLGPGIRKTEPTQGQAVTSKGDTFVRRKKP